MNTITSKNIINLIISFLITFAVYNLGDFASSDILLGVLFVIVYGILKKKNSSEGGNIPFYDYKTHDIVCASHIISAIWTLLYAIYAADKLGGGMENRLFTGSYAALTLAGIYLFLYFAIRRILIYIVCSDGVNRVLYADSYERGGKPLSGRFSVKMMLIYAGVIFICLLPLFLMNFPGTMTVDSFVQMNQALGIEPYTDQHPWMHTLLIKFLVYLGWTVTGSIYGGIAFYTLTQMILCSFAVAYMIVSMGEMGIGRTGRVLLFLGYIIYPYNIAYSITMWKDVLFGASVLVLLVTVYRIWVFIPNSKAISEDQRNVGVRDIVLLCVSGLGTCLFRHNGFYAFILTTIVIVVIEVFRLIKQKRTSALSQGGKKMNPVLTVMLAVMIFSAVFKGPVQEAFGVGKNAFAYNLPIPLQQIARVVAYNGDISAEDMAMIERINETDYLRNEYTPGGADPTEQWLIFGDSAYLESHKAEYLGLWIRLGLKNPIAYLEAYADVTKGYYTTMFPEQTEFYGILPNFSGLDPQPVMGETIRVKANEILFKLHRMIPVYAILYSPGACFQLLMLGIAIIILKNKRTGQDNNRNREIYKLLVYLPVVAIMLTVMIATPLVADLRYAYPLMISMPVLIIMTLM
ncbi:MAG: DUF6020 family protein [Lachnospiraceae bacterium]|nr:DUF6020 family protein [Lachnospiraceae bacterium]